MVSLLFMLALVSILVIGGTAVSLFLYTRSLSEVNHARHERHLQQGGGKLGPYMDYTTEHPFSMRVSAGGNEMSRYVRNGLVFLLFGLVVAAMVIASIINGLMR
jgi:hypothetical protein